MLANAASMTHIRNIRRGHQGQPRLRIGQMAKAKKTLEERIADADMLASRYLGDFNRLIESGYPEGGARAQRLLGKSQYWHDRYSTLTGQA